MCVERRILAIPQPLRSCSTGGGWLGCKASVSAGYRVAVVCPKGSAGPVYQVTGRVKAEALRRDDIKPAEVCDVRRLGVLA